MSADELNVMRYVGAMQLLHRYEHKSGKVYYQYVCCLSEMAVAEGDDIPVNGWKR